MHDTALQTEPRLLRATLRPRATAPRVARRLLRELARGTDLPTRVVDDATFVLGELVTLSLQQVGRPMALSLVIDGRDITVRIHDDGTTERALRHDHTPGATRQWDVVRRLAASWGYSRDGMQRELWATIRSERELVAA